MDRFGKFYWMLIGFLLAIIIVLLVMLVGNLDHAESSGAGNQTQGTEATENRLMIHGVTESTDTVTVKTNFFLLKYPYAFSDMISVDAINDENKTALMFCAQINGEKYELYELALGGREGFFVGTVVLTQGQAPVNMYATIYEIPTGLRDDERLSFIAAQETMNDVLASLNDNLNFEPAA